MLTHLCVRNYVLIKELDIDWHSGFSVITGETGAGKSILLGAIGLLTGQRADSKSILPGATKCTIEGTFSAQSKDLHDFFEEHELDYEDGECIIRRELTSTGKSRCFINDTPVSVADLRSLAHCLVDIHSQHQNLLLGQENFQMNVLDAIAQNEDTTLKYHLCYKAYKDTQAQLEEARQRARTAKAEEDYLSFQLSQIEALCLKEQEDAELQEEQQTLTHAEEIQSALYQATMMMGGENADVSLLDGLKAVTQTLQGITRMYPAITPYEERVQSTIIELKDIETDLRNMAESIEGDPRRLEEVNKRLDAIYTLEQKHGVQSSDELMTLAVSLQEKLKEIEHGEETVTQLEQEVKARYEEATLLAQLLTKQRQESAKQIVKDITSSLCQLEIPENKFEIRIDRTAELTAQGADKVTFLFSANKNMMPRPIAEVASGGEIARVMLALKALMGTRTSMPTIIFDEIDTGVSGRVSDAMARMMKQMSSRQGQQVIAITHLPQIAAQGEHHLYVYKENTDEQTLSHIRTLTEKERITEVAHMLSGSDITQAAIENAKQLLEK